jgi:hypothetical protein
MEEAWRRTWRRLRRGLHKLKICLNECNQVLFVLLTLLRPPMSLVFKLISFGILIHLLASYPFVGLVFLAIDHG